MVPVSISSCAGPCVWHVVGLQRSVRDRAIRQGSGGRTVRQEQAQGILVAARGMLAAWGPWRAELERLLAANAARSSMEEGMATDPEPTVSHGLLIGMPWIELILEGKKTWELRGRRTTRRGPIALIRKGSGRVVGMADLVDVHGPMSRKELLNQISRHQVPPERLSGKYGFAWELRNARRLPEAVPYRHPSGAVIWVVLSEAVRSRIASQTSG